MQTAFLPSAHSVRSSSPAKEHHLPNNFDGVRKETEESKKRQSLKSLPFFFYFFYSHLFLSFSINQPSHLLASFSIRNFPVANSTIITSCWFLSILGTFSDLIVLSVSQFINLDSACRSCSLLAETTFLSFAQLENNPATTRVNNSISTIGSS